MQHVNNILIVCFQKNYENLCPGHERPSFGFSCRYSIHVYGKSGLGIFCEACGDYFLRKFVPQNDSDEIFQGRTWKYEAVP